MTEDGDPAGYDAWYDSPRGRWIGSVECALLASLLRPEAGSSLLDVGCGTGHCTRLFAHDIRGLVVGLDCNVGWLAFARAVLLAGLVALATWACASTSAQSPPPVEVAPRTLEVFVRDGCPHCADAKRFLTQLAVERPDLRIVYRDVDRDERALDDLARRSRDAGIWPPGVPAFAVGERMLVGFDDAGTSGPAVLALIEPKAPPAGTHAAVSEQVDTALFGTLSATRLGMPAFTLAMGLLDGFNPCAMWVLLFLLSLLVRLRDRTRMALVAGTFVLVSGAAYYAFMAAWLNVFLFVGMTDTLRWTLAVAAVIIGTLNVKDFAASGRSPSLAIPASARPGIYARVRGIVQAESLFASLAAATALAVVVNFFELLCTAGLPAVYTAVLAQQQLPPLAHYAYLGLYIVGYVADDALMVATAVVALGNRRLTERGGRWLKLVSGAVMLALGFVMALRPQWLA